MLTVFSFLYFVDIIAENTNKVNNLSNVYIYGGIALGIALIIAIIVIICTVKHRRKAILPRTMSLHDVKAVHKENPENQIIHNAVEVLGNVNPKFTSLELLVDTLGITLFGRDNLEFVQNLGEGAFGKVVFATRWVLSMCSSCT